jgi:hypothetical protein
MAFNEPVLLKRIPNDPDKRKLVTYDEYVKTGGYASLKKALEMKPDDDGFRPARSRWGGIQCRAEVVVRSEGEEGPALFGGECG